MGKLRVCEKCGSTNVTCYAIDGAEFGDIIDFYVCHDCKHGSYEIETVDTKDVAQYVQDKFNAEIVFEEKLRKEFDKLQQHLNNIGSSVHKLDKRITEVQRFVNMKVK